MTQAETSFPHLQGHRYMNLTTFRKSGAAVPTPVWFAEEAGKLYVVTGSDLGKVKRIRNNGRVEVAPCNARGKPLGPSVEGVARILPEADFAHARALLDRKYRIEKMLFDLFFKLFRPKENRTYLEVVRA